MWRHVVGRAQVLHLSDPPPVAAPLHRREGGLPRPSQLDEGEGEDADGEAAGHGRPAHHQVHREQAHAAGGGDGQGGVEAGAPWEELGWWW